MVLTNLEFFSPGLSKLKWLFSQFVSMVIPLNSRSILTSQHRQNIRQVRYFPSFIVYIDRWGSKGRNALWTFMCWLSLLIPCIYIFWHLHHTLQTMIQHIYSTLLLKCTNIIQVLSWNLQYGTRCTPMQRNILKERTQLVEAKLANSKWTNHQPRTVWCLGFAVNVLPAWSSLAVLHIVVVFHRKYCDKRAQPTFSRFFPFFCVFN